MKQEQYRAKKIKPFGERLDIPQTILFSKKEMSIIDKNCQKFDLNFNRYIRQILFGMSAQIKPEVKK